MSMRSRVSSSLGIIMLLALYFCVLFVLSQMVLSYCSSDELCSVSDIMNGRLESKDDDEDEDDDEEEEEEEDEEEDDDEEADEQDALHNSSPNHRIAELVRNLVILF